MAEPTAEQFAQLVLDRNLIDDRQLQEIWGQIGSREISCEDFRQQLLRREVLTNYQVERLLRGDRHGFFYGEYKILYLVGTGTFARVYRAAHRESGKMVAVKVLRARHVENKEEAERFFREGEMGAELRHPNIVPIFEVRSQSGIPYIVMDFVEGRNLREFIKIRKKLEPLEATKVIADVAAGLAYAAERGICHRDLKLSNILVSSRGQGKIVDFGLAGGEDEDEENSNPRTIDYAGLERATGVRRDDPRSDIYFLGAIYYHILTGMAPIFETKDRTQRLSRTRFQNVTPVGQADPTLPKAVIPIVNKAMDLNASLRYQTPAEMCNDLKVAIVKLSSPEDAEAEVAVGAQKVRVPVGNLLTQRTLMVVEASQELQDIFRERLKTSGYRVLVTRDPERALQRFAEDPKTAECVVFGTGLLGQAALDAFNQFAIDPVTEQIPAVLLLGEHHHDWKDQARLADHRVALSMPLRLRELREALFKLVPVTQKA